jgi:prolyl 4-hydroxylase
MMDMLTKFWELNKGEESAEEWGQGDTYTNHWTSPPYVVDLENPDLEGGGPELKSRIWEAARSTIQEWTGQHLTPCSLYGIRVYKEGSILASHVDRMPLVSSAIINVAQDVDEDWPIEVYAHDGKAYNITMQPGDMVLYESHSVIHGRPFPLKGRYYANVFIHFEPMGSVSDQPNILGEDSEEVYRRRMEENEDTLPSYVIPGSAAAAVWRQEFNSLEKMEVSKILLKAMRSSVNISTRIFLKTTMDISLNLPLLMIK